MICCAILTTSVQILENWYAFILLVSSALLPGKGFSDGHMNFR
jgi:hypothetical protein